jgi:hypothetical protein
MLKTVDTLEVKEFTPNNNSGSLGLDGETTVRAKHLHIRDVLF